MTFVKVGRFDDNKLVEVEDGATIEEALEKAGYEVREGETVRDTHNQQYSLEDEVEEGGRYFLVRPTKNA